MVRFVDSRGRFGVLVAWTAAMLPALLMSVQMGCDKSQDSGAPPPPAAGAATQTAAAKSSAVADARPASDPSLTDAQYIDAGVPAHDRPWSPGDYEAAVAALTRMAATRDVLPRWHSSRSGALFDHMVDIANLEMAGDPKLPLGDRLGMWMKYLPSGANLLRLYYEQSGKARLDRELVELEGFIMQLEVSMLVPIKEFIATLDPKDPSYAVRMGGLKRMRMGMGECVSGALETLGDLAHLSVASRLRMCEILTQNLPLLMTELPDGTRREVPVRLARLSKDEREAKVRAAIDDVRQRIVALPATKSVLQ